MLKRNALEVWPQMTAFCALLGNMVTATNLKSTCGISVLGISPEGGDAVPSPSGAGKAVLPPGRPVAQPERFLDVKMPWLTH